MTTPTPKAPAGNLLLDMMFDDEDARLNRQVRLQFRAAAMKEIQGILEQLTVIQKDVAVIRKEQREHNSSSMKWQELEAMAEKKREEMETLHSGAQQFTDALERIDKLGGM